MIGVVFALQGLVLAIACPYPALRLVGFVMFVFGLLAAMRALRSPL